MPTDTLIRTAKPQAKVYKLPRENGLFVIVHPNGSKWWRLSYTFQGKKKLLSPGLYPEVSLALARRRREEARAQMAEGSTRAHNEKPRRYATNWRILTPLR